MTRLYIPLNIQRFAATLYISAATVSQDIANNRSTVRITVQIHRTSGTTYWQSPNYRTLTINCDGQSATHSTELKKSPTTDAYYSSDFVIPHNADGTKSISFSASIPATGSFPALSASGSATLATIPRYFTSTPTCSVVSYTETSVTFRWTTSETCNWVRYHLDGSSSWVDVFSGSGTTGTFTISGLGAASYHSVYCECRRQDSSLWSNSTTATVTTYDYPKVTTVNPFIIGGTSSTIINISNPLNRHINVTLNLANNNSYTLLSNSTYNGGITGEFNTSDAITAQYNSIPSARSGIYSCTVYCSDTGTTKNSGSSTYSIKNDGTENPTFDANSWSYVADLTSLTHNDQVVINGQSTLTFTVNTAAQAKYGASIKEYRFKWGNASKSSTVGYTVPQGNGNILTVEAIDTRELSTVTTKTLSSGVTYLPYLVPNLEYNFCNTHRTDGITAEVKLNLYGTLSVTKFGNSGENNNISSAKYRIYDYDISDWTQYYTIPTSEFTYSDNTFRLEDFLIHANGSSGGFTVGKRYLVQIELKDGNNLLGTFTSQSLQITDGKLARDVYQDINGNYHQGINGLADDDYTETIHGDININGNYYKDGQLFSGGGDTLPINSILSYDGSSVPDGYEEVVDYSTSEINTQMKWIDGRAIYRLVITGSTSTKYDHAITGNIISGYGMRDVIRFDCVIKDSQGLGRRMKNYYYDAGSNVDYYNSWIEIDGCVHIRFGSSYPVAPYNYIIILEYTKN